MTVSACSIHLPVANRFCPGLSEPWKMRLAKMLDSPCLPQWADLQRKAWVKLLGSPTHGQQLGEPLSWVRGASSRCTCALLLPLQGFSRRQELACSPGSPSSGHPCQQGEGVFSLQEAQGMSVPAVGHGHGTAKALACSVPLRCGLVVPA